MDESDELLEKHQDYTTWVMSIKTTPGQLLHLSISEVGEEKQIELDIII